MDQRTENRIEGWDSKPLTGGFAELRELADGGFSGVARTERTTLFMLNGRVVGVGGGSIEDFEDAQATVSKAPHPSLPLLFAMKQRGGEQQAKYYTNDTPISEAHQQLSEAQFTGYIELSENVLSGDYYVLYYGGRSMSCAIVGNSERLEVGDEAFELADDEVGIYEVMSVDLDVTDIPDPGGAEGAAASESFDDGPTAGADEGTGGGAVGHPGEEDHPGQEPAGGAQGADGAAGDTAEPADTPGQGAGVGDAATDPRTEPGEADRTAGAGGGPTEGGGGREAGEPPGQTADSERAEPTDQHDEPAGASGSAAPSEPGAPDDATRQSGAGQPGDAAGVDAGDQEEPTDTGGGTADGPEAGQPPRQEAAADRAVEAASGPGGSSVPGAATASGGVPKSQAAYGELRAIPSLSPEKTAVAEPGSEAASRARTPPGEETASAGGTEAASGSRDVSGAQDANVSGDRAVGAGEGDTGDGQGTNVAERASQAVDVDVEPHAVPEDAGTGELRQQLAAREERIEELEAAITDLRVQRDGLTDERDRLAEEVERLETEAADLESEVERLRSQLDDGMEDRRRLSRKEALEGTNLFVRYDSKSGGTLEKAHGGEVDRDEVNENLRIEHHTQFDTDAVVVDDVPYDRFLADSIYHRFVEWVVRELLYEIQDTGTVTGLRELYDAIPRIDRAELLGDVSVQYTEDGEQYREQRSFDVVLRDRMGNSLVVANLNDSRNPADSEMMETVIGNGSDVKQSNDALASAMMVTESFFKPGALEAADQAHGGGLLSRESKRSYVKLGRKKGYHLILVESREGDFHVNVPEL